MPASLRKACHACTRAKRRCIPDLPACERCVQKNIKCVYDLEPVVHHESTDSPNTSSSRSDSSASSSNPSQLNIVYPSVGAARDASIAAVASGQSLGSAAVRPMLMAEGELVEWLIAFFSRVARDGLARRSSPFVHSRIFRRELDVATKVPASLREAECAATIDRLHDIHNLVTRSLNRLLIDKSSVKKDVEAEQLMSQMFSTTHALWSAPPKEMSDLLCPWEAWLVAESIRRSMFAAVMIRGMWFAFTHGFIYYQPFFESLPFDARAGLWEAETEQDRQESVRWHGSEHTTLTSYHEFITSGKGKLSRNQDGHFQRLLFACYHGCRGIAYFTDMDGEPARGQGR